MESKKAYISATHTERPRWVEFTDEHGETTRLHYAIVGDVATDEEMWKKVAALNGIEIIDAP